MHGYDFTIKMNIIYSFWKHEIILCTIPHITLTLKMVLMNNLVSSVLITRSNVLWTGHHWCNIFHSAWFQSTGSCGIQMNTTCMVESSVFLLISIRLLLKMASFKCSQSRNSPTWESIMHHKVRLPCTSLCYLTLKASHNGFELCIFPNITLPWWKQLWQRAMNNPTGNWNTQM